MPFELELPSKSFVVTGGNRGIGYAISRAIAQAGARVAVLYRSSADAPAVARALQDEFGVMVRAYQVDVADSARLEVVYNQVVRELGPIGGLVAAAGIAVSKPAVNMTRDDFLRIFQTNTWGPYNSAACLMRLWIRHNYHDGRIVIVSSIGGRRVSRGTSVSFYQASKAAASMLGRSLAQEWARYARINVLDPGYIATDMTSSMTADERRRVESTALLNRFGTPDEVANLALFLLSNQASYCVGTSYVCDGGIVLQ
ncbi:putative NADP-dependent mannitol dehydrogenase [Dacryopinax primogenitus]|uniref:Putative NADP-dependent mannitol dehydrogenase n=1 Tax=Dacryopinax primogenitus (strain DJM 731) TaxID=1858805 RepID=M5G5D8_DACPD|nr:putative NADP-dependent mannitol dehydrogenase [Dacryopinax primogenitus]EJT98967.1 putative NADP-dependent mannitol dehydrogenase [Dacryopinax primogenitus]